MRFIKIITILLIFAMLTAFVSCGEISESNGFNTESNTEKKTEGKTEGKTENKTEVNSVEEMSTAKEEETTALQEPDRSFESLTLPSGSIKTLQDNGLTPESYSALAKNGNNGKLNFISTMVSPDYTLFVNGISVPVYCSLVYVGDGHGTIQSFATVFVNTPSNFELDISISLLRGLSCNNPILLQEATSFECKKNENNITSKITDIGNYTLLRDEYNQDNCLTIFVKENVNDAERIEKYKNAYGENNVKVYEAGTYELSSLPVTTRKVLYFCKGALVIATPNQTKADGGFIEMNSISYATIAGYGVLELSLLEHSERVAIRSYSSNNITLQDLMLVNGGSWNVYFYNSFKCKVSNLSIIGHRMNSDGINICNCRNTTVQNCWVRTGDDCFSGKTLGGSSTAVIMDVSFQNCTAWAGKARCFGITGEALKTIANLTFSGCNIVFQDAVWDLPRLGALAIVLETGSANYLTIQNVLFEDIYMYCAKGAPMNVNVYGEGIAGLKLGVTFKNIVCKNAKYNSTFYAKDETNTMDITLENVQIQDKKITDSMITKDAYVGVTIK